MRIKSSPFLVGLVFIIASSSISCRAQTTSPRETSAKPPQVQREKDSSAPAAWKRYDFDNPLVFSMILPNEPEQRVSTFLGKTETSHVFISTSNSGVYGAIHINDLPSLARHWESAGNKLFYEIFINDLAMKLSSRVGEKSIDFDSQVRFTSDRQVTVSSLEGWERDFSVGDSQGRAQLVRVGKAGLCIVAIWKQAIPLAERDAFFNSVKIAGEGY